MPGANRQRNEADLEAVPDFRQPRRLSTGPGAGKTPAGAREMSHEAGFDRAKPMGGFVMSPRLQHAIG